MVKQPLYEPLPSSIQYIGHKYRLQLSFDRVLEVYDTYRRSDLDDRQKLDYSLWLLCGKVQLTYPQKSELLDAIYTRVIDTGARKTIGPKTFDFLQDAPYIYAGFRQAYSIDLFAEQGRLHWWAFIHLFSGLPEDTKVMQIIGIRARPLPKSTKHNSESIQALLRAKEQYRLDVSQEERDGQLVTGLKRMAGIMEGMSSGSG